MQLFLSFYSTDVNFCFLQGKSVVRSSDSGDSKASPPSHTSSNKEHLSSIVREISQARLISLRKKRSGQSMTLGVSDNSHAAGTGMKLHKDNENFDKKLIRSLEVAFCFRKKKLIRIMGDGNTLSQ